MSKTCLPWLGGFFELSKSKDKKPAKEPEKVPVENKEPEQETETNSEPEQKKSSGLNRLRSK